MSELPIEKLGPYNIIEVIGRGGMGSVFSATHEVTGEQAAIKVLSPAMAADGTFRERFIAEIESLKTLNHPNIVTLHGYGESDGHIYYAMELVEGTNLEQELQLGRRFTWREVTEFGIKMSRALKHAHDHGVIHRDLKPANLLLDRVDDEIKLTDFGIAKLFGATSQTFGGSVMGTADYMAPEQAAGESTTPRCDLYSLGCVMYALLTGTPPFKGKNIAEVVHKVRYEQPPPITNYTSDVPVDLQQIIEELLEKDPEDRIRTALSLSHRLRAIQQALSISTTDKDGFSSDSPAPVSPHDQTNRIVNPPPDIAERPTVFLPSNEEVVPGTKPRFKSPKKKKKLDHFTRVELEKARVSESSRINEFSSAVPLLLLVLTVIGGLMGGLWYSTQPLTSDQLHARISSANLAEDDSRLLASSRDIDLFVKKFPDDARVEGMKSLQDRIAILKLQRNLKTRARRSKETGKLSPIEVHTLDAIRAYREGNVEEAISTLEGIRMMFGDEGRSADFSIRRVLGVVSELESQWTKELTEETEDLVENLSVFAKHGRALADEHPERARRIWQGVLKLYEGKPWATEFTDEARRALEELDRRPKISESPEPSQPDLDNVESVVEAPNVTAEVSLPSQESSTEGNRNE